MFFFLIINSMYSWSLGVTEAKLPYQRQKTTYCYYGSRLKFLKSFLRFILTGQNGKLFNFYIPINEHAINILFMTIPVAIFKRPRSILYNILTSGK